MKLADNIKSVGLIGNSEKRSCAEAVTRAAQLIRRARRRVLSDPITARLARLDATVCGDAAALAHEEIGRAHV